MFAPRKVLIYCCKFKNIFPSTRKYAQQLKYNLEIEKKYLSWLIHRINFNRSGTKYFMHYIVCGRAPNVSLLAGYILLSLCWSYASENQFLPDAVLFVCLFVFFFSSSYSYLSHPQFSLLYFVAVNLLWISFSFFVCKWCASKYMCK